MFGPEAYLNNFVYFFKEDILMNKAELVVAIAEKTGTLKKKDAEMAVNAFIASVEEALVKGEKVQLIGFGTFEEKSKTGQKS